MNLRVTIVHACQRDGQGGSPTAVTDEMPLSETERRAVPVIAGTSHVVFLSGGKSGSCHPEVSMRFFTATGELPACGHGTVAALAVLAERARTAKEYEAVLRAGGRTFTGRASGAGNRYEAAFDLGPVELSAPATTDSDPVLSALGVRSGQAACVVASVGRPRMLVQVADRAALAGLAPDMSRLCEVCDRLGLLGCYVYSTPSPEGRVAARMFAPSIGVPEDIANANSTACLAAYLAGQGRRDVAADMGDSLGEPATITAVTRPGPAGHLVEVGGAATVTRDISITP